MYMTLYAYIGIHIAGLKLTSTMDPEALTARACVWLAWASPCRFHRQGRARPTPMFFHPQSQAPIPPVPSKVSWALQPHRQWRGGVWPCGVTGSGWELLGLAASQAVAGRFCALLLTCSWCTAHGTLCYLHVPRVLPMLHCRVGSHDAGQGAAPPALHQHEREVCRHRERPCEGNLQGGQKEVLLQYKCSLLPQGLLSVCIGLGGLDLRLGQGQQPGGAALRAPREY